jgi:uncharacterized membrane protein YraQ (UPF0718 family)
MTQLDRSETTSGPASPLTADERQELERLRSEVGSLRATGRPPRRKVRWRSVVSILLIVLGCVLAPVAGVAVWTHNQVSDTDRFVRSVSPLIDDPDVQNRITDRVTATIFEHVDVKGLADEALKALEAQGLPPRLGDRLENLTPTLASAVTGFVHDKVAELVASPRFEAVWNQVLATAHRQAETILSGDSKAIVVRGDSVLLDLAPFIDLAKQRLSAAGVPLVDQVPEVHPTVELAKADTLVRAQTAYNTLNTVADVLPWIVLGLLVVGVYLARDRFRAMVGAGLGLVLAMLVLAVGLLVARSMLVGAVPPGAAPATASGFDIVVTYLRYGLRALIVLGLVIALAGYLAGRSESAVRLRRWSTGHLHSIRGGPAAGGPVATWVRTYIRALRIGAVLLAVLAFVFLDQPTGAAILVIAALLLLVLAVIEFLGRPETAPPTEKPADERADEGADEGMSVPEQRAGV